MPLASLTRGNGWRRGSITPPPDPPEEEEETLELVTTNEGGWSEPQWPKSVEYNGYTYTGSVAGTDGDVIVTIRNNTTGAAVSRQMVAALGGEATTDMHNNATVLVRSSDHKLLVFWCRHASTNHVRKRISTTSLDTDPTCADGFAAESTVNTGTGTPSAQTDYPQAHQLTGETDDPIYLIFRSMSGATARWLYVKSTDQGATWSGNNWLYQNSGFTTYIQTRSNGVDRIDLVAQNKNEVEANPNSVGHAYYTGGAFYKTDGTLIATAPISPALGPSTITTAVTTDASHLFSLERDASTGDIAFVASSAQNFRYTRWNGSTWSTTTVGAAGGAILGAAIDPGNIDRVWWIKWTGGRAELQEGTFDGVSWTSTAKTVASSEDWFWPQPVWNGSDTILIVIYGQYTTYLNWTGDIYVLAVS